MGGLSAVHTTAQPLLQLTSSMSTAGGSGVSLPVLSQLALEKRRLATVLGVYRLFGSAAVALWGDMRSVRN